MSLAKENLREHNKPHTKPGYKNLLDYLLAIS